ncbi:alpha/beta hydrolase [Jannaschia sp. KMU-145]|uniref:alpha/beta hydrolase n=1 Tax=Jannaschia halovivens TaxID=3388667 RepID=UPI00396AFBA6
MPFVLSRRRIIGGTFRDAVSHTPHHLDVRATGTGDGWERRLIGRDRWIADLRAAAGTRGVVLYLHGYNTPQSRMLAAMTRLAKGLAAEGCDDLVVGLDWPSDGNFFVYNGDRSDAERVATTLIADLIAPVQRALPASRISLLAHSMGAYLFLEAISKVRPDGVRMLRPLDEVMFCAADVRAADAKPGTLYRRALRVAARRVTNYHSALDRVLLASSAVWGFGPRLGKDGLMGHRLPAQGDVDGRVYYDTRIRPGDAGVIRSHGWWLDDPVAVADMAQVVAGTPTAAITTRKTRRDGDQVLALP